MMVDSKVDPVISRNPAAALACRTASGLATAVGRLRMVFAALPASIGSSPVNVSRLPSRLKFPSKPVPAPCEFEPVKLIVWVVNVVPVMVKRSPVALVWPPPLKVRPPVGIGLPAEKSTVSELSSLLPAITSEFVGAANMTASNRAFASLNISIPALLPETKNFEPNGIVKLAFVALPAFTTTVRSNAPMSNAAPCGRLMPRWSAVTPLPDKSSPAFTAGLVAPSA